MQGEQVHTRILDENQIKEVNNETAKNVILIQAHNNKGYAAGNNLGIKLALKTNTEYILIINNDILVEKDSIINLIDFMDNHPEAGIAGPKIVDEKGKIDRSCARRRPKLLDYFFRVGIGRLFFPQNRWVSYHYYLGEYHFDFPKKVDLVSGSCMLIRKKVFSEIGLLDENTFLYLEEFILHEKLRNTKMHNFIVPQSQIVHKKARSVAVIPSSLQAKMMLRSLCYYLTSYRKCNKIITYLLMASAYLPYRLKILKNHILPTQKD